MAHFGLVRAQSRHTEMKQQKDDVARGDDVTPQEDDVTLREDDVITLEYAAPSFLIM